MERDRERSGNTFHHPSIKIVVIVILWVIAAFLKLQALDCASPWEYDMGVLTGSSTDNLDMIQDVRHQQQTSSTWTVLRIYSSIFLQIIIMSLTSSTSSCAYKETEQTLETGDDQESVHCPWTKFFHLVLRQPPRFILLPAGCQLWWPALQVGFYSIIARRKGRA